MAYLAAVANDDDAISLGSLLDAAAQGVNLSKFSANRNLTAEEAAAMFARSPMRAVPTKDGLLGYSSQRWANLKSSALEQLAAWHQRAPDMLGPSGDQIFSGVDMRLPREVCAAMVAELVAEGRVAKDGVTVRLSTHQPRLNPADAAICEKILPLLDEGGLRPPTLRQMADAIGEDPKKLEFLLVNAARLGLVIRISQNRFIRPVALRRLTEIVEETAKASTPGLVTAAAFRDRSGIGRDLSIEVLEFFDRMKFTRRVGDAHHVLHHAADAFNDRAGGRVMNPDLAEKNRTPVGRPDFKSGERR